MPNVDSAWNQAAATRLIAEHRGRPGALLPILHALQDRFGHVPSAAVGLIAGALQISKADVHGVISFYHHFRTAPPGRRVVQVCRAEACQAQGGRALEQHARCRLGIDFGQTRADGEVTLEAVYCLGNCACGPSIRIGDRIHGRVGPERFDEITANIPAQPEGAVA